MRLPVRNNIRMEIMSTAPDPILQRPKPRRRWIKITARVLVVVFVLWVGFVGFMWRAMYRSPEGFAPVMSPLPREGFLVMPFETLLTHVPAGTGHVGDPAPAFSLTNLDKSRTFTLS